MNKEIIDWERRGNLVKFYLGKNGSQWGDDWDDIPWEDNAGRVYDEYVKGGYCFMPFHFALNVYDAQHFYSKKDMIERKVPCIIVSDKSFDSFGEALKDPGSEKYYFGDKPRFEKISLKWEKIEFLLS